MTRNSEGNLHWDSDRGYEDDDDLLSLDSDVPYSEGVDTSADVGYGDEIDSFDEVDTIADELSWMGFHSANDLG
jgi:hypothetical protein